MPAGLAEICVAVSCAIAQPAFFPKEGDFRMQHIHRQPSEKSWPFTVDAGLLMCVELLGAPEVYFAAGVNEFDENNPDDLKIRILHLAKNPFDLAVIDRKSVV